MNKIISPKIIALTFGILTVSFLAAFYVVAWQEPAETPPGGNAPAPIHVGSTGQTKSGNLVVNALGISGSGVNIFQMPYGAGAGKVLTSDASGNTSWQAISIPSGIPSGMIAMFDTDCPAGWARFASLDNRVPRGSSVYGGTGGFDNHSHVFELISAQWVSATAQSFLAHPAATFPFTYNTQNSSSWPPYLNVIWCKKD